MSKKHLREVPPQPVTTPTEPSVVPFGSVTQEEFTEIASMLTHWQLYAGRLQRRVAELEAELEKNAGNKSPSTN